MDHQQQDWTQVKWNKTTQAAPTKQKSHRSSTLHKLDAAGTDSEPDSLAHATVSLDFKMSLQKARLTKKMSQADLAKAIHEVPKVVNEYESGKAIPNQVIVNKMNRVLGVHLKLSKHKKSFTDI